MDGSSLLLLLFLSIAIGLVSASLQDGEPCEWNEQCSSKKCSLGVCATREGGPCNPNHPLGCASGRCQLGRCVMIAKGGNRHAEYCMLDEDCYSGKCHHFKDYCVEVAEGGNRGGQDCIYDADCYSGTCQGEHGPGNEYYGLCSPESMTKGKVGGGGFCKRDRNCFSNVCYNNTCSKDSPKQGKVAGGEYCDSTQICFSAHCVHNKCTIDSPQEGKSGEHGYCRTTDDCYSGYCRSLRCVGPVDKIYNISGRPCIRNDDCYGGNCTNLRCTMNIANLTDSIYHRGHGRPCAEDKNCMPGGVCFGKCEDQSKAPVIGASCLVPSDCEPLKCTNLKCVTENTTARTNPMNSASTWAMSGDLALMICCVMRFCWSR